MAEESKPRGRPRLDGKPAGSVPQKPKGMNGGSRVGAGRPKGSKNIYSKESVKKLEELDFDPIERMVIQHEKVLKAIEDMEANNRTHTGAYASLQAVAAGLINNLMQYGYRKIPDRQEVENIEKKPLSVVLTVKKKDEEK